MELSGDKTCPHKTFSGKPFEEVKHIINSEGTWLFCRYWKPETAVKALVLHIHGYAEHCGRSQELAEKMKELGIFSFAHDHVGHGESEGLRAHIKDYQTYVRDILQHIDLVRNQHPGVPLFLYGHSLGGGLAIMAANEGKGIVKGILLSAPLIQPAPGTVTPMKVFFANLLTSLFPTLPMMRLELSELSRDQNQVDRYKDDPLVYLGGVRVSMLTQLLRLCDDISKILPEFDVPIFVAHSEKDTLTDISGSKLLVEVVSSKDITTRFYKEPLHTLEHETEDFIESYFADVLQWLQKRI